MIFNIYKLSHIKTTQNAIVPHHIISISFVKGHKDFSNKKSLTRREILKRNIQKDGFNVFWQRSGYRRESWRFFER